MNKKRNWLIMIVMVLIIVGCSGSHNKDKEPEFLLRLAEAHPSDYPTTKADEEFAKRVYEATDGRIQIVVYDDMALGDEKSVIEQLQFGAIDLARVSSAPVAEICEPLNVLQLPYLYEDSDHMWRVLDSEIGDYFLNSVEPYGFIGLAWYDAGARSFYNAKYPIESISDIQGMKFRVLENQMMIDMVDALGATAVPMSFSQVYESIQLGEIDGAENNFPSYEISGHYKVAKYFTIDAHTRVPEILIASQKALESLSEEDITLLRSIAQETESYQRALWEAEDAASKAFLEQEGVLFNTLENDDDFRLLVAHIHKPYEESYGNLLDQIADKK